MWEGEHKDGSVKAKQKGAGQWVWGWEGRGACAGWGLKW